MKWATTKRSDLGDNWTAEHHLRREHHCTQHTGHGSSCGNLAYTTRDGQWLCPEHAARRDWEAAHQEDEPNSD